MCITGMDGETGRGQGSREEKERSGCREGKL